MDIEQVKISVNDPKQLMIDFGVAEELLTKRGTACPVCQDGVDRFSYDGKNGGVNAHCRYCGSMDYFTIIGSINGWDFHQTLKQIADHIGVTFKRKTQYQNSKYKRDRHNKRYLKAQQIHCLAIGSKSPLTEEEKARHSEANRFIHDFKKIYPNHLEELGI